MDCSRCHQIEDFDQEMRYLSVLSQSLATLSLLVKTQQFLASALTNQEIEQMEHILAELDHAPPSLVSEGPPTDLPTNR